MKVGDKVEITEASVRYPWKRHFIGRQGVVDEITSNGLAVRFVYEEGTTPVFPVWFAEDCVKAV